MTFDSTLSCQRCRKLGFLRTVDKFQASSVYRSVTKQKSNEQMNCFRFRISPMFIFLIIFANLVRHCQSIGTLTSNDLFTINVTMNGYDTTQEDEYAFVQYKLPDEELYVVGYSPLINMVTAHHMLTYACSAPGSNRQSWKQGGSCVGDQMIIHGWARNAPPLKLPDDVGFAVGRNTPYKYIVVNIHYLPILKNDHSGNQLIVTRKPRSRHAGVILSGTNDIYLRPKTQTIRTPFSCTYNGPPISIFAVRVHAHRWGRVNSLYRVRNNEVSEIVKGDPHWPQSFYPLSSPFEVLNGDYVVGQCVYDNNDDLTIQVGSTGANEMCNVYAMYSYEPSKLSIDNRRGESPPIQMCWGNQFNAKASLIPASSEIPPPKPTDISGTDNHEHAHSENTMDSFAANRYTNIEGWPDIESLPGRLGQVGGIAISSAKSELVVFHRGSRVWENKYFAGYRFRNEAFGPIEEDVVFQIDTATGKSKSQWGAKMFYMPHGLTVDHEGNFWLTDVAMHQVLMFKQTDLTRPALTVGERFQFGSGPNRLCRPADVAVLKNGDFFVADGYCNSRIVKFNGKGEYVTEWGSPMSGKLNADGFPQPNEWNVVHSITVSEESQLLCGADRENFRIQCFDLNTGKFLRQIHVEKAGTLGAIYAVHFAPNTNGSILFAVSGGDQTLNKKVYMIDAYHGNVLMSFEPKPRLNSPHDIAVSPNAGEIYVGELASSVSDILHKFQLEQRSETDEATEPTEPNETHHKLSFLLDRNVRITLFIILGFAIPIVAAVTVGFIIRLRNIRKLQRLNSRLADVEGDHTGRRFVFGNWLNRRRGFEVLEQYSDGENEPFDPAGGESLNNNSDHESTNTTVDKLTKASTQKKDPIRLKMGDSL